jgi:hypothetical protein
MIPVDKRGTAHAKRVATTKIGTETVVRNATIMVAVVPTVVSGALSLLPSALLRLLCALTALRLLCVLRPLCTLHLLCALRLLCVLRPLCALGLLCVLRLLCALRSLCGLRPLCALRLLCALWLLLPLHLLCALRLLLVLGLLCFLSASGLFLRSSLCVGRSSGSKKQEQTYCADNSD